MFVTSASFTGDLVTEAQTNFADCAGVTTGIDGADCICQSLAEDAGLSDTYRAWLSNANDTSSSPLGRFNLATFPYVLVDGTQIAADFADLTDGTLDAGIDLDETGVQQSGTVWSATETDGDFRTPTPFFTCDNWSSKARDGQQGTIGDVGGSWTFNGARRDCNTLARLYCFEQ